MLISLSMSTPDWKVGEYVLMDVSRANIPEYYIGRIVKVSPKTITIGLNNGSSKRVKHDVCCLQRCKRTTRKSRVDIGEINKYLKGNKPHGLKVGVRNLNTPFDKALDAFIRRLQRKLTNYRTMYEADMERLDPVRVVPESRGRYIRLFRAFRDNQKAYCFIDPETGDILKPFPRKNARHLRGNIYKLDHNLSSCGPNCLLD